MSLPIREMYSLVTGTSKLSGMSGYKVPKSNGIVTYRDYSVPKGKRNGMTTEIQKRAGEPGPANYSPTMEQTNKRYWNSPNGRFEKTPRRTVLEEVAKRNMGKPAPGSYSSPQRERVPGGKWSKAETIGYLSEVEYMAEETPGTGKYFAKADEREKAYGQTEKRSPGLRWKDPKAVKVIDKSPVGPGYLKELEGKEKLQLDNSPKYSFSKSKITSSLTTRARDTVNFPPVGYYKNIENAFSKTLVVKKDRTPVISKYKFDRFTESEAKQKKWVPGPGAYDILPKFRVIPNK